MSVTMAFSDKATVSDAAVECLAAQAGQRFRHLAIFNEGAVAGWFSVDGTNWRRLPANTSRVLDEVEIIDVQIKRTVSGSNLATVHGDVW